MTESLKRAGSIFYFLPILLLLIFSFIPLPLSAMGSGEFSKGYDTKLQNLFKDLIIRMESGEINGEKAKKALALLRSQYRIDYNDFAGKIDSIIDEVEENKKEYQTALNEFTIIRNDLYKVREETLKESNKNSDKKDKGEHSTQSDENSTGRGNDNSSKKN